MTVTAPKTGYAPVNGLQMYYEIHGSGQPLLLLHGGFLTIELWEPLLTMLAEGRQVIAVELQAHGRTADIDRPLRYEQLADDAAALLQQIAIDQTDVFGYSLGGGVALQLAIRHPQLVRTLVAASAAFKHDGWYPEILGAMAAMTGDVMVGTPLHEAYVRVAPRPDDWSTLVARVSELQTGEDSAYDWSEGVAAITAPTLLIYGDADSVRPQHAVELFHLLGGGVAGDLGPLPPTRLTVIPGTAHSAMLFRTDVLHPTITAFLDTSKPEGQ
jgi:pimeloyl-ACP methyl ester carboxylesterase